MEIKQNSYFKVPVRMVNSTSGDGDTALTYADVTVYIQKQAGTSTVKSLSSAGQFVEVDATNMPGVYDLALSASDFDTVGFFKYSVSATDDDKYIGLLEVVANIESDTYSSVTALPAAVSSSVWNADRANHVAASSMGQTMQFTSSYIDAAVSTRATQAQILSDATPFAGANIDVAVSSRMSQSMSATGLAQISASIWNAVMTGHTTIGSAGRTLTDASASLPATVDYAAVSASVWNANRADHLTAGSMGQSMQFTSSYIDAAVSTRSTGQLSSSDVALLTASIWNALRSDHITNGTFGNSLQFTSSFIDIAISSRTTGSVTLTEGDQTYFRWSLSEDAPLFMEIVGNDGLGLTGSDPHVAVRRYKTLSGPMLDNYYWDGATFTATPVSHSMTEVDPINQPGLYTYIFSQSLVQAETLYTAYYTHNSTPVGFVVETHAFANSSSLGEVKLFESEPD